MRPNLPLLMRVAGTIICVLSIFIPSMTVSGGMGQAVSYSSESFYDLMNQQFWGPITLAGLAFLAGAFLCLFFEAARYLLAIGLVALFLTTFLLWPYLDSGVEPGIGCLVPILGTALCFCAPIVRRSLGAPAVPGSEPGPKSIS